MGLTEYPFILYPIISIQTFSVVITMLRVRSETSRNSDLEVLSLSKQSVTARDL